MIITISEQDRLKSPKYFHISLEEEQVTSTHPCIKPLCSGILLLVDMYRKENLVLCITKKATEHCHWISPRAHSFWWVFDDKIVRISLLLQAWSSVMRKILLLSCPSLITKGGLRLSPFSPQAESKNSASHLGVVKRCL